MPVAEIISIGNELLQGRMDDTNATYVSRRLTELGIHVKYRSASGDGKEDITAALRVASGRADIVISTGGLGPTHDDVTRPVIAAFFGDRLEVREELRDGILQRFVDRGLNPAPGWEAMAKFPTRAKPIPNNKGAAPGIHFENGNKQLFAIPGVPAEMMGMVEEYILPRISQLTRGSYQYLIIRTIGIGESHLSRLIGDPARLLPVGLAFLPSIDQGVTLRLSLYSDSTSDMESTLSRTGAIVQEAIRPYIYATEEKSLEAVIVDLLRARNQRLGLAESSTGGMIAARIVNVSGSSDVFDRGLVTYSNEAKTELLGVSAELIEVFGAVSEEAARAMAEGVRDRSSVDFGLSVTGIAGPGGGSEMKPVGLTYIGLADSTGCEVKKHLFAGTREENRRRATLAALSILYHKLAQ